MKILVDTHIFVWAIMGDPRLSSAHRALYLDETKQLFLSLASIWEMLIKIRLGKLSVPTPALAFIVKQTDASRINLLPILVSHLAELERLPLISKDPFDRMLVAQARAERMPVLSADPQMQKYDVQVL
jgi:PIN domain nuclease of toxin-antitoxin system